MKVAATLALLPLLVAAAPAEDPQLEKRTGLLLGLIGSICGRIGGGSHLSNGWGWGNQHSHYVGRHVGDCGEGNVYYAGQYNNQEYYGWGNQPNPAPLNYCRGGAWGNGSGGNWKRDPAAEAIANWEAHSPQEKRTLGLIFGLIGALVGQGWNLKCGGVPATFCGGGKYLDFGKTTGWWWWKKNTVFTWEQNTYTYSCDRRLNGQLVPYYRCSGDGQEYPWSPCQGNVDTGVTVDPNVNGGCCSSCGGCGSSAKRSIDDLE